MVGEEESVSKVVLFGSIKFTEYDGESVKRIVEDSPSKFWMTHRDETRDTAVWGLTSNISDPNTVASILSSLRTLNAPNGLVELYLPNAVSNLQGASLGVAAFLAIAAGAKRIDVDPRQMHKFVFTGFMAVEEMSFSDPNPSIKPIDKLIYKIIGADKQRVILFCPIESLRSSKEILIVGGQSTTLGQMLEAGLFYTMYHALQNIPYDEKVMFGVAVGSVAELLNLIRKRTNVFPGI